MRIAIDAMGGDLAPREIIKGVLLAGESIEDVELVLAGRKKEIEEVAGSDIPENVSVSHSEDVIGMNERPLEALRKKKDSSIARCVRLVKEKKADAFISAGNTGAVVAASYLALGFIAGVKKPGIAIPLPTPNKPCLLIDVGANIQCKPLHLLQYGIMAGVYSKYIFEVDDPKISLLNVGSEEAKGNPLIKETYSLFQNSGLNFSGFVEGQELFDGDVQVAVCDGFVGNSILKVFEGFTMWLFSFLKEENVTLSQKFKEIIDFSEYGGAPLLGVNGVCIICHGRSDAKAIYNAIRVACNLCENHINDAMRDAIRKAE